MINFIIAHMRKALFDKRHVMPDGLTREQFKEWMAGNLKFKTDGININPKLAFNPLPAVPPKAPPPVPR